MALFFTDEHTKLEFDGYLRDLGHTVERVRERLWEGVLDSEIARLADEDGAVIVTANQSDFDKLVRKNPANKYPGAGLLYFTRVPHDRWQARLDEVVDVFDFELARSRRKGHRFALLVGQVMVQIFR